MSFPAYEDTKPSGIPWIGEVPITWDVVQGRRLFAQKRDPSEADDEQLSATQKYGVLPQSKFMELEDQKVTLALSGLENFKHVQVDDFVISLRSFQGGIEHSAYSGCVSPAYTILRPNGSVHPPFWKYLMKSKGYIEALQSVTDGIRDGKNISYEQFGKVYVPDVPPDEQKAISSFLDVETSKIDGLVSEQRRLIELLKEKRQAVISHAVTKGLNPNAPMKPSGIQWLGDVPQHWGTDMISRITSKIGNGYVGPTRDILAEEGVPYVQATHIKNGRVNFDGAYFVTEEWSEKQSKAALELGDVLIVQTGAGTGDIGLVSEEEVGYRCHALIIVRTMPETMLGSFLAVALQSQYGVQTLESIQTGGMHPHLNCGNVKFVHIPIPPIEEQKAIVDYVNQKLDQFSQLQAEAERAIELLQERRTALISAAVTGKINVRGFADKGAA